jgi:hypothetical protein
MDANAKTHGDILALSAYFSALAAELYDGAGRVRFDRTVVTVSEADKIEREGLPNAEKALLFPSEADAEPLTPKLFKEIFTGAAGQRPDYEDFEAFLANNGVQKLSPYYQGGSAITYLGWKENGGAFIIRIPGKYTPQWRHRRLKTPLAVQADAALKLSPVESVEILDFKPVIPDRGWWAVDHDIPGHNLATNCEEFSVIGSDGYRKDTYMPCYDDVMGTFAALLKLSGYEFRALRDIALLPEGTPIFVDPDTLTRGKKAPDRAYQEILKHLPVIGDRSAFQWPALGQ